MRVTNDDDGPGGGAPEDVAVPSGIDALVRLQADFQARLAEETLRYLRRLQAAVGPAVPGTVVVPDPALSLRADGEPGGSAELALEIANTQQVHCIVTPAVSPFVHASGATWYPAVEVEPATLLVAPGDSADLRVRLDLPAALPAGEWHGALLLHGFGGSGIATTIAVTAAAATAAAADDGAADAAPPRRHGPSRGPVRPRVPHPTPARGRTQQVVLPAVPPDLAARLEES